MQQISYLDVENLFKTDPKGILNRKAIHKWQYPISAKADPSLCKTCKADFDVKSSPVAQEMFNIIGKIYGQLEPGNNQQCIISLLHTSFLFFR